MFEKTLTGRFSCVNNKLGFDTEVHLPNHSQADFNNMNTDQIFKAFKRQDLKTVGKKLK